MTQEETRLIVFALSFLKSNYESLEEDEIEIPLPPGENMEAYIDGLVALFDGEPVPATKGMTCMLDSTLVERFCKDVLDDDNGISEKAFLSMTQLLQAIGGSDLLRMVEATDGRFYLEEE